jgi:hypothetical protein
MKSRQRLFAIWAAFLAGCLVLLAEYPKFKKIEKRGTAPQEVAAILPGGVAAAGATIGAVFNDWAEFDVPNRAATFPNKFPSGSKWSRFFLFRKNDPGRPLFPSDDQILLDRGADDFVKRYVQIPAEFRNQDLYLYEPSGDYFWDSEYFYKDRPAKFRCSFVIHVEPAGDSQTKVEIFEYQPTIWVGEYLGISAHAVLPTMLHDIRPAEATTVDRQEVLLMIEDAATSPARGEPRRPR